MGVDGAKTVAEDAPEEEQGAPLERIARGDELVLELDHQRVDVDLVAGDGELPRLAQRLPAWIELAEPEAGDEMTLGPGPWSSTTIRARRSV